MVSKVFSIVFMLLVQFHVKAQRERIQTFSAGGVKEIILQADEIFKVEISTVSTKEIKLFTISEGEYFNDIQITAQQTSNKLYIASAYKEILTSGFDKLSAHKVYAVNLKLIVPENLKVIIVSNIASVYGEGKFNFLEAELNSGDCVLQNYYGKALINTLQGDVFISTKNAKVTAETNNGSLFIDKKLNFGNLIEIKSINGDVEVKKIQ
ncbi:hypothetical protein SAMN04488096_103117 [Mesonia phycicola]|uniref:Adhesin n=1 Tax=Mesonia phycicola TaxID=579105 RepID=A0A1M6CQX3_9FLAO|nr:hypothetical protein [Mesonia phycicola]SHI63417.1 hypothetical protein SAMN04488096_103117 [Mesonia phycicola]